LGKGLPGKSFAPGQAKIKNELVNKTLAVVKEYFMEQPPVESLEEARKRRVEDKLSRHTALDFLRARTQVRIARREAMEKAEKEAAEKKARRQAAKDAKEGADDDAVPAQAGDVEKKKVE
jgi:hypothetical protein